MSATTSFVKVRHKDGRSADITKEEVPFYRSIGFDPVDGAGGIAADFGGTVPPANERLQPPANGTDQRLDLIYAELKGLRADIAGIVVPAEPIDGETVELRGAGEPPAPTREEALAAHPNLTGASDIWDAEGKVIAQARGIEPTTTTSTTTPAPTTSTTTTPAPTTSTTTTKAPKP